MSVGQSLRTLALVAVVSLVSPGCQGGDDTSTDETAATTVTTVTTVTTAPIETTEVSTTASTPSPVSSTSSTTAVPPSTSPVPTSSTAFVPSPMLYPPDDPRAAVETAYLATEQMWVGCAAALPQCDTSIFPNHFTGFALALNTESRTNQNTLGYLADRTEEYVATVQEVTVDGDVATVLACEWDPIKVFRPATAEQPEQVLSDVVASEIKRDTMLLIEGRWLLEGGETVERVEGGESLCD